MIRMLFKFITGGAFNSLAQQLVTAYQARQSADSEEQRRLVDLDIARIEAALRMAEIANADRWSATSLGRYLIVLPFGMWWSAIFIDSTFDMPWVVLALPEDIMDLAEWLVPVIVAGDVGKTVAARYFRK